MAINEGFSSAYGARPLKRLIQTNITNKVAHMILSNEIDEDSLSITTKNSNLEFNVNEKIAFIVLV